jgi:16S rRNA (uracil1498-N3)-methyltransferase
MSRLYLDPGLDATDAQPGATLRLGGDEARHAVTVARVRVGESISIGNGRGLIATGDVVATGPRELELRVGTVAEVEQTGPALVLVQALAKGDRDERAVQAATELGVDRLVPWAAERSVSRWTGTKLARGVERWESIAREATKQSIRAWLPSVSALASTAELCRHAGVERMLVLDPTAENRLTDIHLAGTERISVVVGPEGGISPGELELLETAGAARVRLGPTILRTSSAGPAALAVLNARLGRW